MLHWFRRAQFTLPHLYKKFTSLFLLSPVLKLQYNGPFYSEGYLLFNGVSSFHSSLVVFNYKLTQPKLVHLLVCSDSQWATSSQKPLMSQCGNLRILEPPSKYLIHLFHWRLKTSQIILLYTNCQSPFFLC